MDPIRALYRETIDVEVLDGTVRLSGNARSATRKWLAEQAACRVRGVLEVRNDLIADEELRARIAAAIGPERTTAGARIGVDVLLGMVHLTRLEATSEQMPVAEEIAPQMPAVRAVKQNARHAL